MNFLDLPELTPGLRLLLLGILGPAITCLLSSLVCRYLARGSAATRHLVWLLAFVAMAFCLPLALFHFRMALPILPARPALPASLALSPPTFGKAMERNWKRTSAESRPLAALLMKSGEATKPATGREEIPQRRVPWSEVGLSLWASGFLYLLLTFIAGFLRLGGITFRARTMVDDEMASLWTELHHRSAGKARLLLSSEVKVPLVTGWWRPVVILPESSMQWPLPMLRAALVHELAHIERHDLFCSAFARLVAALYWFNPLAWSALRSLHAEAEMAADDCVVVRESQPVAYAESLVTLVRNLRRNEAPLFPAVGMLRSHGLEARIARILDPRPRRLTPRRALRWSALAAVVIVTTGTFVIRPVAAAPPPAPGAAESKSAAAKITLPPKELLIQAIAENDLAKAHDALKAGANPNEECSYVHTGGYIARSTPLYFAAELGSLPFAQLLVDHGASVSPGKSTWTNAIDAALRGGFGDVARYLHEQGATCDPLSYAAATGDLDSVKKLAATATPKSMADAAITAAGCRQIDPLRELLGEKGDPKKAFLRAAATGAVEPMQFLLDRGVKLPDIGDEALLKAASKEQPHAVAFLLKAGVKPNPEKHVEKTALHEAAEVGAMACARLLLEAGADPNSRNDEEYDKGSTPLFSVCTSDNPELARLLLDHGSKLDVVNEGGFTPVLYAAYSHAPRCLALFIDRGADLKPVNPGWKCGVMEFAMIFSGEDADRPDMGMTMAQISKDMETARVLLDKGMDVNATGQNGATPLSIAIQNGQTASMEMLLQRGAKVNTVDGYGGTLLIRVIAAPVKEEWRLAVIDRLFQAGVDPNVGIDNPKPAEYAVPSALKAAMCQSKSVETARKLVEILLAHGARFPVEKKSEAEAMLLAASTGDLATVQALLAKGVSPNVTDARGWTPLLSASALNYHAILHALLEAGAEVKAHDALGFTPLYFTMERYPDLADFRLLLDKGADVNFSGKYLYAGPVLYGAIGHNDPALTRELLKRGASPNLAPGSDEHWIDPLERAVDFLLQAPKDEKAREIVKLLLQFGAEPNLRRARGRSLLFFPVANDLVDVTRFLLDAGIDPRKDRDGGKEVLEQAERNGGPEMKALIKAALEKPAKPQN